MNTAIRCFVLAMSVFLMTTTMAIAAPRDVHHVSGGLFKTSAQMAISLSLQKQVSINPGKYLFEGESGKLYTFAVANQVFKDYGSSKLLTELAKKPSAGNVNKDNDFEVISIE